MYSELDTILPELLEDIYGRRKVFLTDEECYEIVKFAVEVFASCEEQLPVNIHYLLFLANIDDEEFFTAALSAASTVKPIRRH